jgi:hypothetical protein
LPAVVDVVDADGLVACGSRRRSGGDLGLGRLVSCWW